MDSLPTTPSRGLSTRLARTFLVVLRLIIGWHLLVQGYEKIHSVNLGITETNKPWTSRGFLLESQGPFAPWFRRLAGDPDLLVQEFLRLPTGDALREGPAIPVKVEAIWDQYHLRFLSQYRLAKTQKAYFENLLKTHKDGFLRTRRAWTKNYPAGTVTVETSLPEQIEHYQQRRQELRSLLDKEMSAFGREARRRSLVDLKAEVNRLRTDLLEKIAAATAALQRAYEVAIYLMGPENLAGDVASALVQPQGQVGPLGALVVEAGWAGVSNRNPFSRELLAAEIPITVEPSSWLAVADFVMKWGLFLSGGCLILGLFTRLACVVGALLLLLIFAAMMPLPGLPAPPVDIPGRTLFVDQTLIEGVALLALATQRSGEWLGLDALWQYLPWRRRRGTPAPVAAEQERLQPIKAAPTAKHKRYTGA